MKQKEIAALKKMLSSYTEKEIRQKGKEYLTTFHQPIVGELSVGFALLGIPMVYLPSFLSESQRADGAYLHLRHNSPRDKVILWANERYCLSITP